VLIAALITYAAAMVAANLTVAQFGPSVMPFVAFALIGMDLALRDWLHIRLKPWHMAALIAGTSVLTFMLNPAAERIAFASAVAFGAAALADWAVFARLPGSWFRRANGSNVAGAAVDSLLFPTLAFGALMPGVVLAQFVAKVAGGALWAWVLSRRAPVAPQPES
jgi:uncharacterized PurR-regulated membrane protein YhhQ (DUF165 family)